MPSLLARLKTYATHIKREIAFYQRVLAHPLTPKFAKCLIWLAVGYFLLPFDLIPDFIPVLGQLDDLVLIPLLIAIALRLTPQDVLEACRNQ